MAYKKLIKVSNVCQLLDKSKYPATHTSKGIIFTNNGDGTITVNSLGITETTYIGMGPSIPLIKGHKYMSYSSSGNSEGVRFYISIYTTTGAYVTESNFTIVEASKENLVARPVVLAFKNSPTGDRIYRPQFIDLTEMYGAGNEPTTFAQFRQDFPEKMYDYSPRCWATSYSRRLKVSNVCQLLDKRKFPATTTKDGITWTNNGDGTITVNGTATAFTNILVDTVTPTIIKSGHKFLMLGCPLSNGNITTSKEYWMQEGYEFGSDRGVGSFFSLKGNNINLRIYIQKDYTANNLTFKPQIFDLTEMYGAGHEPTTVEQFKVDFPNELYDYKPYSILPSYQRNLTCKTKNLLSFPYYGQYETKQGITFSKVSTYKVNASGVNTFSTGCTFDFNYNKVFKAGTYTIKFYTEGNVPPELYYRIRKDSYYGGTIISDKEFQKTFTLSEDTVLFISFGIYGTMAPQYTGKKINVNVWCQIEKGDTATEYVPYGHL